MAGIKISALPAVPSALTTDYMPVVQGGVTSKETLAQIQTLFGFVAGLQSMATGGTNANLTAALGAVPYITASSFALLAPGASGQLFQSGGAGAPVWTTATYPATASTSGKVIVSDGTNFSSSFTTAITAVGAQAQALNMNTHLINAVVDPVSAQDAATKNYVDNLIAAVATVFVARLASTTALTVTYANGTAGVGATLTNAGAQVALSLDGTATVVGNLVLIKNQAAPAQNGYYTVTNIGSGATNWILTRSTLYDQASEINPGDLFVITAGTANANTSWLETAVVTTIGTDAISFSQYSVALPIVVSSGGTGLATLTAYGIMTAGTTATGNMQQVTIGASGTILQSGGASALPAFTTATYPAVATGAGTLLRADGTNWLASTSTYPNTNAVSTLLYASSANVMAALATANNGVLVTSNTGVPSILAGPGSAGLALLSSAAAAPVWSGSPPITRINVQRVTTSGAGTYTPTSGMVYVIVGAQAAGGGGGGAIQAGATQFAMGTGGGGGEYIEALFTAAQIGASKAYSVGAKGAKGAAGNNAGTAGGNTTFNTTFIAATGGAGGAGGASAAASQFFVVATGGSFGGTVATGTLIRQVAGGNCGVAFALVTQGQTSLGGGSASGTLRSGAGAITGTTYAGTNAIANSGCGGDGGATYNAGAQQAGGDGADGFLIFTEYLSV